MSRILLLIQNPEDRRLLSELLVEQDIVMPATDEAIETPFDLCIVDDQMLTRVWPQLRARKQAEAPVFLPILLVTSDQDIGMINPEIWTVIDELLLTPLQKAELTTRISILSRMRRMSVELERRHEELFRTLVEDSPTGVFLLADDRFTYINEVGAGIFGYRADEIFNRLGLIDLIHAEDRPALVEMLRQHHAGERETIRITLRGVRKDGGVVACDIYGRRSRYFDHPALMGQIVDVTERYRAERARDQFLAVLSHELRTPLTNILGWVKEAQELPEIVPEALEIIQRNAEEQSRMLQNLLEVTRMIHGKLILELEPADLWEVTAQAAEGMQSAARESRVAMELVPPAQSLSIMADVKRLYEVIRDLLDNAIKYTEAGGTVTITGQRRDNSSLVRIHDTGRGIAPEQLPTLFTLFRLSPEVEATGGLHLGLPLAKYLIEQQEGQLDIDSPGLGQGTTVTVTLPLRIESAAR